jgi:hypothetical protein
MCDIYFSHHANCIYVSKYFTNDDFIQWHLALKGDKVNECYRTIYTGSRKTKIDLPTSTPMTITKERLDKLEAFL